ncbi:flagellar biosynthetic protein FliO [Agrobacterium sp. BA1120]|uniref:flagellar biosynthetic protein FliO n=1 Tax=Agrobacterium sp. BA1120 TaxID=3228927 RepID=UPI00336A516C
MMDEFIGTYGNNLIVAVVGVGVALLALAIILWIIRRRGGSSPFIRGGKNRQPRLQVLDATAVDARRRLVLVRRDNVEHLVMIGGPTDIVIESGIGAIPILRDVRDPQDEMLTSEKAIAPNRQRSLPPVREEELRSAPPIAAAAAAPQPEAKAAPTPSAVAAARPAPAPAPRPVAPTPTPAATVTATPPAAPAPRPVAPPVQSAPDVAPVPKAVAREPIVPPVAAAVVPAVTVASLQADLAARPAAPAPAATPVATQPIPAPTQVVSAQPIQPPPAALTPEVAPEPIALREAFIDQNSAVDFLDAARERVLPTFRNETPISVTANVAKPEPLAPNADGTVFGDQLTSDFESFLQAEIEKNNASGAPDVSLDPRAQPQETAEPVATAVSSDPDDRDVQKEMARIFGEMAVTRDR